MRGAAANGGAHVSHAPCQYDCYGRVQKRCLAWGFRSGSGSTHHVDAPAQHASRKRMKGTAMQQHCSSEHTVDHCAAAATHLPMSGMRKQKKRAWAQSSRAHAPLMMAPISSALPPPQHRRMAKAREGER